MAEEKWHVRGQDYSVLAFVGTFTYEQEKGPVPTLPHSNPLRKPNTQGEKSLWCYSVTNTAKRSGPRSF